MVKIGSTCRREPPTCDAAQGGPAMKEQTPADPCSCFQSCRVRVVVVVVVGECVVVLVVIAFFAFGGRQPDGVDISKQPAKRTGRHC